MQSVTEMEYARAFSHYQTRRMPMLIYLADERTRIQPNLYFNAVAINTLGSDAESRLLAQKLESLRRTLLSRHICKFFTTPQELALQVSTDLSVTSSGGYASQGHILQAEAALRRGDVVAARAEAQVAVAGLPGYSAGGDQILAARARFLLALAVLGRQPIITLADNVFTQVCDLLQNARQLQQNRLIYTLLLAAVKREYAVNGFRHLEAEAAQLLQQAQRLTRTPDDDADMTVIRIVNPTLTFSIS
jgi:hypothetical protein